MKFFHKNPTNDTRLIEIMMILASLYKSGSPINIELEEIFDIKFSHMLTKITGDPDYGFMNYVIEAYLIDIASHQLTKTLLLDNNFILEIDKIDADDFKDYMQDYYAENGFTDS